MAKKTTTRRSSRKKTGDLDQLPEATDEASRKERRDAFNRSIVARKHARHRCVAPEEADDDTKS